MLFYILLTLLIIYITVKLIRIHNYWTNIDVTHHAVWPIFGYIAPFLFKKKAFAEIIGDLYKKYPNSRYVGTQQYMKQVLVVRDINIINKVVIKDFDHFMDRPNLFNPNDDSILGKTVSVLQGEEWRTMRNTLTPAFTSNKMKIMFHLISDCAKEFTDHFEKQQCQLQTFETKEVFSKFSNDVIATVAFGIKCNSLEDPNNEFYSMGKEVTKLNPLRLLLAGAFPFITKFFGFRVIKQKLLSYFSDIIQDSIYQREKLKIFRPDLIHLLMEARQGRLNDDDVQDDLNDGIAVAKVEHKTKNKTKKAQLSDIDIAAQAFVFFFAGFETIATFMSLMSYELALNPEIQKKLQNEIDEVRLSCQGEVPYEKLMGMKYLDMVLAETLRKSPPAFLLERICIKDYTIVPENSNEKPLTVKKGQTVMIPVYGIHRDPQFYPNPDQFDPERFNQENKSNFNPRAYFPFGMGPRSCIASRLALLETKLLFFNFLSKFSIVVVDKTEIPLIMGKSRLDMLPDNGNWLGFKKRKKNPIFTNINK